MFKRFLMILILPGVLGMACDDDNPISSVSVEGSGVMVTETRDAGTFHSIVFAAAGNVNIGQTDSIGCQITADDNVVDLIVTRVEDGVLYIEVEDGYNLVDYDLTVNLSINTLETVTLSGVGVLSTVGQIQVNQITFVVGGVGLIDFDVDANGVVSTLTGVASLALSGSSDSHTITSTGVGNINAFDLVTGNTTAVMTGIGNAEVYSSDQLTVTIAGLGSVYYKGNPSISATITGTGRLINAN